MILVEGSGSEAVTYTWHGSSESYPLQSAGFKFLTNLVLKEYLPNMLTLLVS